MLGKMSQMDLDIIKAAIINTWGEDCVIERVKIMNVPVPQFRIFVKLYNSIGVCFAYDRGTMDIGIKQENEPIGSEDEYLILQDYTTKKVYRGFEIIEPDIMKHNFSVLDEVVCQLVQQQ